MRKKWADQRELQGAALLHLRSRQATSRSSLAQLLDVSPSTAGLYVDHLISSGYLDDAGLDQGAMGRPKRRLSLRAQAGWFAGVEFNAERVQAVRVDFSGKPKAARTKYLPPTPTRDAVLQSIASLIKELGSRHRTPLLGVGLGAPGVVDPASGTALHYSFIHGWDRVPIAHQLTARLEVPVTLENNLRTIATAERWFGDGHGLLNYVILGPRSGFGIAIVQDGKLVGGSNHAAGEIGRWPWPLNGDGSKNQVQDALSAPAIYRRLAGVSNRGRLPADLHSALARFADSKGKAWDKVIADYARLLTCVHLLIDAEAYFLHGPLTALGPRFCNAVAEMAPSISPALKEMPLRIIPSTLGDDAGALGAASLAMESWTPGEL
jgi:predicted NBD/HSP70 family sugar kinase